ncbi:hypothetical protein VCRA2133E348_120016 [Vibrio crassostreae]|nr:hypothetical protein VCRA2133E348_120016 [Vibrio crassostreae]
MPSTIGINTSPPKLLLFNTKLMSKLTSIGKRPPKNIDTMIKTNEALIFNTLDFEVRCWYSVFINLISF